MSDLIKDLRYNLNLAQDEAKEAAKNIGRAIGTGNPFFDDQALYFATNAAHYARQFIRVHRALMTAFTNPDDTEIDDGTHLRVDG